MEGMDCRRAYETDVVDFVAHPRAPEWAQFRAHYPTCAACAGEVRAWTELHLVLSGAAAHPSEERLLAWETARATLAADERIAVERHLASCRSCTEELETLRRFAPAGAVAAPARAVGRLWPDLLRRVPRVVLHPAFAYALVLALLYPVLFRAPPSGRHAAPVLDHASGLLGSSSAAPATPSRDERDVLARADREVSALAKEARAPAPGSVAAPRLLARQAPADDASWRRVPLRAGAVPEVGAGELGGGVVLGLRVGAARGARTLEVRVVGPDDGRAMTERFQLTGAEADVEMRVPAAWLVPGTYRVEAGDTFSFRVTR